MKRKSYHTLSLILSGLVIFLAGCAKQITPIPPTPEPTIAHLEFKDGLGRNVTLQGPAQRVVSLAPSITESLFAIGAGAQVIGRDEFSNYPAEVKDLPNVGGYYSDYNYETIVDLHPDLVLAAEINTAEQVKSLEDLGLTVYLVANPTSLDEMYSSLETIARLTGHQSEADTFIEDLKGRVSSVEGKLSGIDQRPSVFYELDSTDPNAPYTAGPGTFIDTLINMAGGNNIGAILEDQYGQISVEELLVQNPDIILLGDSAYGVTVESVGQRPGWETMQAFQTGKVYPFDDDLVSRPGPRLVDGLEALAAIIHPDLFK